MVVPRHVGKAEAVSRLAGVAGLNGIDPWSPDVAADIDRVAAVLAPQTNLNLSLGTVADIGGLDWQVHHAASRRPLAAPTFLNERHPCFFSPDGLMAESPAFSVLPVRGGYFGNLCDGFMTLTGQREIIADCSSKYVRLYQYYDVDVQDCLDRAREVDGIVVPIIDDIRPLNFCHWMLDWLPRLAFLGHLASRADVFVATTRLLTEFQRATLAMCGFSRERIIELDDWQALRARELLAPSCLRDIPHPAHKMAPWAVDFLRSRIGQNALLQANAAPLGLRRWLGRGRGAFRGEKIHLSRADAARRRVLNDRELSRALGRFGYRTVVPGQMSLAEQVTICARASHVVGLHGAAMANCVFMPPGGQVIEIFPESYGTLCFYVVATGLGCDYASFVAPSVPSGGPSQLDDVELDVAAFIAAAGERL